jgi:hypothetical protein
MQFDIGRHMDAGHHGDGYPGLIGAVALVGGEAFVVDLEHSFSDQIDRLHEHRLIPTGSRAENGESQREPVERKAQQTLSWRVHMLINHHR